MSADSFRLVYGLSECLGRPFGTEALSTFLYGLVRMQKPERILELGTGFGISALWMALAALENEAGHIWTLDNGALLDDQVVRGVAVDALRESGLPDFRADSHEQFIHSLASAAGVSEHLSYVQGEMDLTTFAFLDQAKCSGTLDLVFSDFGGAGPSDVVRLIAGLLPRLSTTSSLFIDSVPYMWGSYLLLENLVRQLNQGHVPLSLQESAQVDLRPFVMNREFKLQHITKADKTVQAGTSWLHIHPVDIRPSPRTILYGSTLDDVSTLKPVRHAETQLERATSDFVPLRMLRSWLERPNPLLGGKKPLDAMETAEGRNIVAALRPKQLQFTPRMDASPRYLSALKELGL